MLKESGVRLARALNLREGEGRLLAALGSFLLLVTAATTILSAAKNALFLSVFPARFIPHVIIGAAILTAISAILFSGVIAGTARRSLAIRLNGIFILALVGSWGAFAWEPRWSMGIYLLLSAVQVLLVTHAWDYVSDLLTGRQARRLAPLLGIPASMGALLGGGSLPFVVAFLPSEHLLLIAVLLVAGSVPLLWLVPEPQEESGGAGAGQGTGLSGFVSGAGRGLRGISSERLLALLAALAVALAFTGTLIELQFKTALQAAMDRDQMAAVLGILSGVVGLGTLIMQLVSSRWIFPRLGVSFATKLQGGLLAFASGGAALIGGVWILAALQALDDVLQFAIYKPVEQISLLPFPGPLKSASLAALGGVVRPLSKAGAGAFAILLVAHPTVVAWLTVATAGTAFGLAYRHRKLYMASLAAGLGRHSMDFSAPPDVPLVVDRGTLSVLDEGLSDPDPKVVIFAVSLLEKLPSDVAFPRLTAQLRHPVPEVRAEAARVLGESDRDPAEGPVREVREALDREREPFVMAALATTLGQWKQARPERFLPLIASGSDPEVRQNAFVALVRSGWPEGAAALRSLLNIEGEVEDLLVGAGVARELRDSEFLPDLMRLMEVPEARSAALTALAELGPPAVPALCALLERQDLPLPVRRKVVSALATTPREEAIEALLDLLPEPALGPAAVTSLLRLRRENRCPPIDPDRTASLLSQEVALGLRCALASSAHRERDRSDRTGFVADELTELAIRSSYRVTRLLSLSHDPVRLEAIGEALGSGDARARSNALELLEGTLSQPEMPRIIPFAEVRSDGFPRERVAALVPEFASILARPLEPFLEAEDWWLRALALHGLGRDSEVTPPGHDSGQEQEPMMIPLIQRVMILKGSELFRYFPGQELAGIAALTEEVHLDAEEVLFREGEEGDAFYMVVHGAIRIVLGGREIGVVGPREGFGEMAILDREKRSATAIAAEPTTLLRIHADPFDALVDQNPSVARGIYRMLTQRLRSTLTKLFAG